MEKRFSRHYYWDCNYKLYVLPITRTWGADVYTYDGIICADIDEVYKQWHWEDLKEWATTDSGNRVEVLIDRKQVWTTKKLSLDDWINHRGIGFDIRSDTVYWKGKKYLYVFDKKHTFNSAYIDAAITLNVDDKYYLLQIDSHWNVSYNWGKVDHARFPFLEYVAPEIYRIVPHREALETEWEKGSSMYNQTRRYKTINQKINLMANSLNRYKEYESTYDLERAISDECKRINWEEYQTRLIKRELQTQD